MSSPEIPTPRFRVRAFGGLSVEGRDGAIVPSAVNQRKRLAFLALLAASGKHGIARDRLLLLLWPDSTTDRARNALYQLLYVVRQAFGEDSVVGTDELRLDASVVASDVADFNGAVSRGGDAEAVDLYAGPFLDAVHIANAPELERWIEQKRQELGRNYQSALSRLSSEAIERRDFSVAIAFAERLVESDRLSARATVLLMDALAGSGDVSAALERARVHASVVREELGVDVDPTVTAVAKRLRSGSKVGGATSTEVRSEPTPIQEIKELKATPVPSRRRRPAIAWTMTAVIAVGVAFIIAAIRRPRVDRPKEFVVVAQFTLSDTNSIVSDVLTFDTQRALSNSRSIGTIPESRLQSVRQRLRLPRDAPLTPEWARKVAMSDGLRAVVAGYLTQYSGSFTMSLRLISAVSGEVISHVEKSGIAADRLFETVDALTRELREKAGDDEEAIRKQPSVVSLTSSSREAMSDYINALRLPPASGKLAVKLLRDAIALDTMFAAAYWQLSYSFEEVTPTAEAEHRALLAKAWSLRDGLTEYERLRIEIAYKYSPDGINADPTVQAARLQEVVEQYPNAHDAIVLADIYDGARDLVGAEREYRRAISLDSTRADYYHPLVPILIRSRRLGEARRVVDDVARRFPSDLTVDYLAGTVSYAEGHLDEAKASFERLLKTFPLAGYISLANVDLLRGHVAAAARTMRIKDSVTKLSPTLLRRDRLIQKYWIVDRPAEGLAMMESAIAANPWMRSDVDNAMFYAQFGQPDSARALLAVRAFPNRALYFRGTDTLPVYAWIDLAEKRPRDAAEKFRRSLVISGGDAPSQTSRDAEMGFAFEQANLIDSAVTVYEHYLNAPRFLELDAFRLVWVLEHVAPLHAKQGKRQKARDEYQRIVELWKDADPELQPRVNAARKSAEALR